MLAETAPQPGPRRFDEPDPRIFRPTGMSPSMEQLSNLINGATFDVESGGYSCAEVDEFIRSCAVKIHDGTALRTDELHSDFHTAAKGYRRQEVDEMIETLAAQVQLMQQ